jgi:hypothetical protein
MKYEIQKLDGRFTFKRHFDYAIAFENRMAHDKGPLYWAKCHAWLTETYGPSLEMSIWNEIKTWDEMRYMVSLGPDPEVAELCNPDWAWSIAVPAKIRIYLKNHEVLTWFSLKFSQNID